MDSKTNLLLVIAVLAVVVSIANLGVVYNKVDKITGQATDDALVNITIDSEASIQFTTALLEFGSGTVDDAASFAIVDSEGNLVNGTDWSNSVGLNLLNKGNVNVTLNLNTSGGFSDFQAYEWKVNNKDGETGACADWGTPGEDTWFTAADTTVCDDFLYEDSTDELRIDVRLEIAEGMAPNTYTDTITATGTAL